MRYAWLILCNKQNKTSAFHLNRIMMLFSIMQLKYSVLLMKEPAIILRLSILISWSHHAILKQYTSREVVESQVTKTSTVAEEYITIYKKNAQACAHVPSCSFQLHLRSHLRGCEYISIPIWHYFSSMTNHWHYTDDSYLIIALQKLIHVLMIQLTSKSQCTVEYHN